MSKSLFMTSMVTVFLVAGGFVLGTSLSRNSSESLQASSTHNESSLSSPKPTDGNTVLSHADGPIKWMSYDKGLELAKAENKPVYVEFFATWCGYCRKMEQEVFSDQSIQNTLNNQFVAIRVTESSTNKVAFEGRQVTEKELTLALQVTGFPTHLFLAADGTVIGKQPGYMALDNMQGILGFVESQAYKKMDYKAYRESKKS